MPVPDGLNQPEHRVAANAPVKKQVEMEVFEIDFLRVTGHHPPGCKQYDAFRRDSLFVFLG